MNSHLPRLETLINELRAELDRRRAEETNALRPLRARLVELEARFSEMAQLERKRGSAPDRLNEFDAEVAARTERRAALVRKAAQGFIAGKSAWFTPLDDAARLAAFLAAAPDLRREVEHQLVAVPTAEIQKIVDTLQL